MGHTQRVHHGDGAFEALAVTVHAMVVGREQNVEACIDTGPQVFIGRTELRIAGVGLAAQRHLEVADGHVGPLNLVLHMGEALVVVVRAVTLQGSLDLRPMLHQVACDEQAEVLLHGNLFFHNDRVIRCGIFLVGFA